MANLNDIRRSDVRGIKSGSYLELPWLRYAKPAVKNFSMYGASPLSGLALSYLPLLLSMYLPCIFPRPGHGFVATRNGIGPASSQLHQNLRQAQFRSRSRKVTKYIIT
jgi:hypothetical protein